MSGYGNDVPSAQNQTYAQGFMSGLSKSASFVREKSSAGASSVQSAAGQRNWTREKDALNRAGTATKGAALWTKDKTVAGATSVKKAAQERDWTREKGYAASAGSAAKTGAVAVGGGIKSGSQWLWNATSRKTEVIDTPPPRR